MEPEASTRQAKGSDPAGPPAERPATLLERAGERAAGLSSLGAGHPRARAAIQWGVVVLIFGFLIGFVIAQWGKLPEFDWRFRPGWLVLALAAAVLFLTIQAGAWRLILRRLGQRLDGRQARAVWGKSLIARYVPTNALLVVGRVVLAERLGVPKRVCLASIVYELGLAICGAVIVGSYFVITLPPLEDEPARFGILVLVPVALAALHPRVFRPVADYALRKLGREALPAALPFPTVAALALLYSGSWLVAGFSIFAFASAIHSVPIEDLPYVAASQSVAFGVAVMTFIVPSGLGTRDAALATALAVVLPGAVATAIAVAFRIFLTAVELVWVASVAALGRTAEPAAAGGA